MIDVQSQGKRVTGTPWALATASVCNLVSAMIFAVFEAVTTRANSRLCGGPPVVKLKTRSAAPSLGDASVSNMLTNVSRSTASFDPENGDNTFVDRTAAKHMLRRGLQKRRCGKLRISDRDRRSESRHNVPRQERNEGASEGVCKGCCLEPPVTMRV